MKYALGNMLNGAGGLNADQLALDLQFATDKTLTARKGPTPTFTRASSGTFVGSNGLIQSAAVNGPRFDHDPVTLACKGLLIEESRTNSLVRSAELSNTTSWSVVGSSRSTSSEVAPDGGTSSISLTEDTSSGGHIIFQNITLGSAVYTISVFAKAGSRSWIFVDLFSAGATLGAYFNLSNGTIGNIDSGVTASITAHGNGWYRCSVTATKALTSCVIRMASSNGTNSYLGNGTGNVLLWGAQLELGAFPTSYIPTTTASVIRSADVCSISGSAFSGMWNANEGTLFLQTEKTSTNANAFVVHASAGFFSNAIDLRYTSITAVSSQINFSGLNQTPAFSVAIISGSSTKHSVAYRLNDCAYSVNGASPITDQSVSIPTSNQLTIGSSVSSSSHINGTISSIRYYRKRLANAKLQTITV